MFANAYKDSTARSTTYWTTDSCTVVNAGALDELVALARQDSLHRARLCLHRSLSDPVHEMVIAMLQDSYVRPHRHLQKSESYHMLHGVAALVFFSDEGRIVGKHILGVKDSMLIRLSTPHWHTIVPLGEAIVFHEIVSAPHGPELTEFPSWSPALDDAPGIQAFRQELLRHVS